MIAPTDLMLWWLPLVIWAAGILCVIWHAVLLHRYRREGALPPRTIQTQMDMLFGCYDHLPRLRFLRRAMLWLIVLLIVSGLGVMALNAPRLAQQAESRKKAVSEGQRAPKDRN